jgi:hypothetical protein
MVGTTAPILLVSMAVLLSEFQSGLTSIQWGMAFSMNPW